MNTDGIELYLLQAGGFVPTSVLCAVFEIPARRLRQDDDRPGLLDEFAVSSTREGESGYIHQRFVDQDEWQHIESRLRRHSIAQLRRVQRWRKARHNILTGKRPDLRERHTGQLLLIP